jgi:hypothetical protein
MKASQLAAIGAVAFSVSFVAASVPAPSPTVVHKKILSSDEDQAPLPCFIGTEKCSAINDPPKICQVGAKSNENCPTDGFKVIEADSR